MTEYPIAMLGPSRVGKTSLLTVMFDQFDKTVGRTTNLQLTPEGTTGPLITSQVAKLKVLAKQQETLDIGPGIDGTAQVKEYTFNVAIRGYRPKIKLRFFDLPGGWLVSNDPAEKANTESLVGTCPVILVPFDAASLMVDNGQHFSRLDRRAHV